MFREVAQGFSTAEALAKAVSPAGDRSPEACPELALRQAQDERRRGLRHNLSRG
jgi:hypothetical protein